MSEKKRFSDVKNVYKETTQKNQKKLREMDTIGELFTYGPHVEDSFVPYDFEENEEVQRFYQNMIQKIQGNGKLSKDDIASMKKEVEKIADIYYSPKNIAKMLCQNESSFQLYVDKKHGNKTYPSNVNIKPSIEMILYEITEKHNYTIYPNGGKEALKNKLLDSNLLLKDTLEVKTPALQSSPKFECYDLNLKLIAEWLGYDYDEE